MIIVAAIGASLAAFAVAQLLGDCQDVATVNAGLNFLTAILVTYVTQVTVRLDKEIRHGGE